MQTVMAGVISLFLWMNPGVGRELVVGQESYSLENRYAVASVNAVFRDNILLTLAYMRGRVRKGEKIDWEMVRAPSVTRLVLKPGETFAFHDWLLPEYRGRVTITTGAHFNAAEGFRSDGWLVGDGVCHLASFINVVAREAGLMVVAPTRHDFAQIPEVTREMGVSIYADPTGAKNSAQQNLYITNNREHTIAIVFEYDGRELAVRVEEIVD